MPVTMQLCEWIMLEKKKKKKGEITFEAATHVKGRKKSSIGGEEYTREALPLS